MAGLILFYYAPMAGLILFYYINLQYVYFKIKNSYYLFALQSQS